MEFLLYVGTLLLGLLVFTAIIGVAWYVEISFWQPAVQQGNYRTALVKINAENYVAALLSALFYLPFALGYALSQVALGFLQNFWRLFFLFVIATAMFAWLEYQDTLISSWLVARQCGLMPFTNYFLFPLFNIARIIFDSGIILWDYFYDLYAFYEFGPVIIFLKCTAANADAGNLFAYFANIFYSALSDTSAWFQAGFYTSDLDIASTLDAIGLFVDSMYPILSCFCADLGFFWQAMATWFRMPSLAAFFNCLLNFFVRLFQIPINAIMLSPPTPVFNYTALAGCCAIKQLGNAAEDTVFLAAQVGWGIFNLFFSDFPPLPEQVGVQLSTPWSHVFTDPICGIFLLTNMTLVAAWNYDALAATDGSGIAYFQFGIIFDELKGAAMALGSIFILFNNDTVAVVTSLLLAGVNGVAFLFEWVLGNIWYFLFGGPLPFYPTAPYVQFANFLKYYLPNYWLIPTLPGMTTALNDFYAQLFQLTQAIGNLIANQLDMDPLAGIIQHTLNVFICLNRCTLNQISFFFPIFTFSSDPLTTPRQIDWDCIFNELYFLGGSLGDLFRQFGTVNNATGQVCQPDLDESDKQFACCVGNLVELLVDLFVAALQQYVHFYVDLQTLPSGTLQFCISFIPYNHSDTANCVRIPDLTVTLFLLEAALCELTCAVFSVIPFLSEFQCQFPPPPPPTDPHEVPDIGPTCGHISTCAADLACNLLRFLIVPLKIANMYFAQLVNGASFTRFTEVGQAWLQQYANQLANSLTSFGQMLDCAICAFVTHPAQPVPGCDDSIYQLFRSLAQLVRFLPLILTNTFMIVVRLVMVVLIGVFTGNPIKAFVDFIVGLLENVFGGLAKAAVDFLVSLLNAIGLGFLGTFIQALYQGLCPLLEGIVNIVVVALKAITFGTVPINFANFCCDGAPGCVPTSRRRALAGAYGAMDSAEDDWLGFITQQTQWEPAHPCNASMAAYVGTPLANLSEWQVGEVMTCLNAKYWLLRDDDASVTRNSTCDVLIREYNYTAWSAIGLLERRTIMDCMESRFLMDRLRLNANASWLPSDLLYNPLRKFVFGAELLRGLAIYWQFQRDQSVTSDTFLSPLYRENWRKLNLNISHYSGIGTPADIVLFRSRIHLRDYFAWNNNAPQLAATVALTTGFWSLLNHLVASLANTSLALSDTQADPTVLVTYDYFMGQPASSFSSGVNALFGELYQVVLNVSAHWADAANLRKRAWDKTRAAGWGAYEAAVQQLAKAGVEKELEAREADAHWRGLRSPAQTQAFLSAYHNDLFRNERSLVYRLSRWWEDSRANFMVPHRIPRTREDGRPWATNRTVYQYRDAAGALRNETGYARAWRVGAVVWAGSPGAQARWAGVARVWGTVRDRLYNGALRRNAAFAADYVRRTYEIGFAPEAPTAAAALKKRQDVAERDDALARYLAGHKVWSRPADDADTAVARLRAETQALHCVAGSADGLCVGYVPPPVAKPVEESVGGGVLAAGAPAVRYSSFVAEYRPPVDLRAPGTVIPANATLRYVLGAAVVRAALFHADGAIELTCSTNITFGNQTLCEACFFLDQLIGRVLNGLAWTIGFYTSGQYGAALDIALDFFTYIANDNAYVIVGSGPGLGVGRFPSKYGLSASLEYLNDATPNKTGFSDIWAMFGNTSSNNTNATDLPFPLDLQSVNGLVGYVITTLFAPLYNWFARIFGLVTGDDVEGVFSFLANWWFLCDWETGADFLGFNKRWSVGQVLFGLLAVDAVVSIVLMATIQWNLFNLLIACFSQFVGIGLTVSVFWVIQTNFSLLCYFGLPVNAMDDALYFVFYTAFPKCEWFWAFAIADPQYDNLNCYACNASGGWRVLNCQHDLGFVDLGANVVFMLQKYWPDALNWLRTTTILPIALIVDLPYVTARLNAFANLDLNDDVTYRNYVGCNYIGTLIPNAIIMAIFLYLLYFASPLLAFVVGALAAFWLLLYRNLVLLESMLLDMQVTAAMAPLVIAGFTDTAVPQHVGEGDDDDSDDAPDAGGKPMTTSRMVFQRKQPLARVQLQQVRPRPSLYNMAERTMHNVLNSAYKNK